MPDSAMVRYRGGRRRVYPAIEVMAIGAGRRTGNRLSGGQRQRISIARAMLEDALSRCWTSMTRH